MIIVKLGIVPFVMSQLAPPQRAGPLQFLALTHHGLARRSRPLRSPLPPAASLLLARDRGFRAGREREKGDFKYTLVGAAAAAAAAAAGPRARLLDAALLRDGLPGRSGYRDGRPGKAAGSPSRWVRGCNIVGQALRDRADVVNMTKPLVRSLALLVILHSVSVCFSSLHLRIALAKHYRGLLEAL